MMSIDLYLGLMRLKETGTDRILGYYKNDGEWHKIQGDTPQEFINKIKRTINLENQNIILHKDQIKYFENLTPIPKTVDEKTYKEIKDLYSDMVNQLSLTRKSA